MSSMLVPGYNTADLLSSTLISVGGGVATCDGPLRISDNNNGILRPNSE